jgi:hypothetical protein
LGHQISAGHIHNNRIYVVADFVARTWATWHGDKGCGIYFWALVFSATLLSLLIFNQDPYSLTDALVGALIDKLFNN